MKQPSEHRDLFPGALEMMILQTLRVAPLHGYALAQPIKQTSDELLHVEEGSLYPALQRMLKAKWVQAEWGTSATNRRVRIYKIKASRPQTARARGVALRPHAAGNSQSHETFDVMNILRFSRRDQLHQDLEQEMKAHLDERVDELVLRCCARRGASHRGERVRQ